jgi:hypothetical protein
MTQDRRDFIKSSAAITFLTVSKASAQGAQPRKIGIVHSTELSDEFKGCLLAGLKSQGWEEQPTNNKPINVPSPKNAAGQYGGTHGHTPLRNLVRGHVAGGGVHLIVAAGGGVSQASASDEIPNDAVPFVYLSGRSPAPPSSPTNGKYCGVILDTSAQYANAVNGWSGVTPAGVWLVQNFNSEMAAAEYNDWPSIVGSGNSNRFRFFEPRPNPVDNDENLFNQEADRLLASIAAGQILTGVVVSPDPFFRLKASQFKTAMARLKVPICYPFKDFSPSPPDILLPSGARLSSTTYTDSGTAYYRLGLRAAAVLDNASAASPIPTSSLKSEKWDGSMWAVV